MPWLQCYWVDLPQTSLPRPPAHLLSVSRFPDSFPRMTSILQGWLLRKNLHQGQLSLRLPFPLGIPPATLTFTSLTL